MKKNISSRLDEIEEWMNEQLPIDWITRELKCSRDTFRKYFPDYKGNQGGRPDRVAAIRQEYKANPKTCKLCNKVMPFDKRRNAFCSMSCSSKKAAERWKRKGCAQTEELRK